VPLLRVSGRGLADLSAAGALSTVLTEQMLFQMSRRSSPAEARSWDASLGVLAADLLDAGLDDVEVLVEHPLPLTSRRVDAVLAGRHPTTGRGSYVVIELKQWSSVQPYDGDAELVAVDGYHGRPMLHPVAQVRHYCEYLSDFTRLFHDQPDALAGAAYLHNAVDDRVASIFDYPRDQFGQLFTGQRRGQFLDFLRSRLAPTAGAPYADQFLNSGVAPSKELLSVAADEIRVREQFVLLDEQQIAFDIVLHEVEKARGGDHKSVVIVSGGPGSGKSVIALSLLGELGRRGRTVVHATGSRSFTHTLRKVAGDRAPRVRSLFKYFNSFIDAERNGLDVLIADEAHRIRETSADRWTKASLRTGKAQVDELIDAARVPVFLLDEHQIVRPGELGNVDDIERAARARSRGARRQSQCPVPVRRQRQLRRMGGATARASDGWPNSVAGGSAFLCAGRRHAVRPRGCVGGEAGRASRRPDGRGLLLALERSTNGRVARVRRLDRRLVATVEPQRRSRVRRRSARGIVGQ